MADQFKRFARWERRLSSRSKYLISRVKLDILPIIRDEGFVEAHDYAEGRQFQLGANILPFQVRRDDRWPTIEIFFSPGGEPWFRIELGTIEPSNWSVDGTRVPREASTLLNVPTYFEIVKDRGTTKSLFGQFGYHWFAIRPTHKIDAEVDYARRALVSGLASFWKLSGAPVSNLSSTAFQYVDKNLAVQRRPGYPAVP
jgi:hypothetical protein